MNKAKIIAFTFIILFSKIQANNVSKKDSVENRNLIQISGGGGYLIGQHSSVYSLNDKQIILGTAHGYSYFGRVTFFNEIRENVFFNVGVVIQKDISSYIKIYDENLTNEDILKYDNLYFDFFNKTIEITSMNIPIGINYMQNIKIGKLLYNINITTIIPLNALSSISYKEKGAFAEATENHVISKDNLKITFFLDLNFGYIISLNKKIKITPSVYYNFPLYKGVISEKSITGNFRKVAGVMFGIGVLYNL